MIAVTHEGRLAVVVTREPFTVVPADTGKPEAWDGYPYLEADPASLTIADRLWLEKMDAESRHWVPCWDRPNGECPVRQS